MGCHSITLAVTPVCGIMQPDKRISYLKMKGRLCPSFGRFESISACLKNKRFKRKEVIVYEN